MALYSWLLTLVALIVIPIQVAITLSVHHYLNNIGSREETQCSHIDWVLSGIQTVKLKT